MYECKQVCLPLVLSQGLSWQSINVHSSVVRKVSDFAVKMVSEFVSLVDICKMYYCALFKLSFVPESVLAEH